jgi:hypothetical protein
VVEMIAPAYPQAGPDDEGVVRRPSVPCPGYAAVCLSWPWTRVVGRELDALTPLYQAAVEQGRTARRAVEATAPVQLEAASGPVR